MELNLLPILNFDGKKISVSENISLNLSDKDDFQLNAPIHFDMVASNAGGTIELTGHASADVRLFCDRCTEGYDTVIEFEIDERFKKEDAFSDEDENPDIILLTGTAVDLEEILYTTLFMNLPSKKLCSDSCKGLCPVCGNNLNNGECGCSTETTDPRFDILDKLL